MRLNIHGIEAFSRATQDAFSTILRSNLIPFRLRGWKWAFERPSALLIAHIRLKKLSISLMRCATLPGLILLALLAGPGARCDPTYNGSWRLYSAKNGFGDSSFRSVTVAENGNVLAVNSAGSMACDFDGYEARFIQLPGDVRGRVYESPVGQLWACSSNGVKNDKAWNVVT